MRELTRILATVLLVTWSGTASAGSWTSETSVFGTTVSNGEIAFRAPDAKAGEQMAKALNKAEKKAEKQQAKEDRKNGRG